MSSGFNTDVRAGERVFHVQTEDRGPAMPVIDTIVYQSGRIVYRQSMNYEKFHASPEFNADLLRERVEEHHRAVIEDLRAGLLDAEIAAALEQTARSGGIQAQLLNPDSWLTAGKASLEVEIIRRADRQPEAGADVEAVIEGALQDTRHRAKSDERGRAKIEFPLPPIGGSDLALVIQVHADAGKDEIRFSIRSRAKTPPKESAP